MSGLAEQIEAEPQVLIGEPISDCWHAANMQIFEFGPAKKYLNHNEDEVEGSDLMLQVQCPLRTGGWFSNFFSRGIICYAQQTPIA